MSASLVLAAACSSALGGPGEDLITAVRSANAVEAERLIAAGADLEARDERGATPLMWSSALGLRDLAERLIARGADVNARDRAGFAPLHLAAYQLHSELVDLLVQRGADVNAASTHGWTPLHKSMEALADPRSAHRAAPLQAAAATTVVRFLVERGANVNARGVGNVSPLHLAAGLGQPELIELLIAKGAEVNAAGPEGTSPLYLAIKLDRIKAARLLIARGGDVNARTQSGYTPLIWAAHVGNKDAVDFLLTQSADVNARDRRGRSALLWALLTVAMTTSFGDKVIAPRMGAEAWRRAQAELRTMKGQWRQSALSLLARGADALPDADNNTPLLIAANVGADDVVQALIERGADLNDARAGETALHAAIAEKHVAIAELLIRRGADVNVRNTSGRTPLHFVARDLPSRELAELMLARGADVNARDKFGDTPLDFAVKAMNGPLIEVLRERSAMAGFAARSTPGSVPVKPLTLEDYLSLGVPPPDRLWEPGDFEMAALALARVPQRALPRIGDPVNGAIFQRLISRDNMSSIANQRLMIELRAQSFEAFHRIGFPALQRVIGIYAVAVDGGAVGWSELVELLGLLMHYIDLMGALVPEVEAYAREKMAMARPDDADHRRAAAALAAFRASRDAMGTWALKVVELLDVRQMPGPKQDRLRLIQLAAQSLPRSLALTGPNVRREVADKLRGVAGRETDADIRFSLERLHEAVAPRD